MAEEREASGVGTVVAESEEAIPQADPQTAANTEISQAQPAPPAVKSTVCRICNEAVFGGIASHLQAAHPRSSNQRKTTRPNAKHSGGGSAGAAAAPLLLVLRPSIVEARKILQKCMVDDTEPKEEGKEASATSSRLMVLTTPTAAAWECACESMCVREPELTRVYCVRACVCVHARALCLFQVQTGCVGWIFTLLRRFALHRYRRWAP